MLKFRISHIPKRDELEEAPMFEHRSVHRAFDDMMSAAPRPKDGLVEAIDIEDAHRIATQLGAAFSILSVTHYTGEETALSEEEFLARHLPQTAPA